MKNQRFVQEFVLVLLLVVAIGAIALQSNFNFTGYVVNPDGVTCDGGWTCGEWGTCTDSNQTRECVGVNSTNCISPITETQSCTIPSVCDTTHLSLCLDEATCTTATGFWYNSLCNAQAQVVEVCDTTHLSLCLDETNCTTATGFWYDNVCNVDECSTDSQCDSGYTCNSGTCEVVEEDETTTANIPTTTLISPAVTAAVTETPQVPTCTPNWQCGDWQECVSESQARVCADVNNCGTQEGSPTTSQACVVPIVETCSDGLKNQDETRVDCGGVCKKCRIFTIVGSAISGPVDTGKNFVLKEMFGNTTKTIISIGSLVLVIGGLVCFKIFKKRRKK
ncbi:MAG: hypothetical protein AABW47_03760 [Nanoarchaeota archaeon]